MLLKLFRFSPFVFPIFYPFVLLRLVFCPLQGLNLLEIINSFIFLPSLFLFISPLLILLSIFISRSVIVKLLKDFKEHENLQKEYELIKEENQFLNCEISLAEEQIRELEKVLQMVRILKAMATSETHKNAWCANNTDTERKKYKKIISIAKINQRSNKHTVRVYRAATRATHKNQINVNKNKPNVFFRCIILCSLALALQRTFFIFSTSGNIEYTPNSLFISIGIAFHSIFFTLFPLFSLSLFLLFVFFSFFSIFLRFFGVFGSVDSLTTLLGRLPIRKHRHVKTTNTMNCSNEYISWSAKRPSF